MEIKDETKVWHECQEEVLNLIKGITKEKQEEQITRMHHDPVYRTSIDYITQMLFTIKTDERFIEAEKKALAKYKYHEMQERFKMYGVDID